MQAKGVFLGAAMALALAAPAKADVIFDNTSGFGLETSGIVFMNTLYDGYIALSEDRTWSTDLVDAEHFNQKARRAARRSSVMPDEVMDRELLEEDMAPFAAALERLRNAYDRGGRTLAPVEAANAQVAYDCWIEAAEGSNPDVGLGSTSPWRLEDVERCKAEFEQAMAAVEAAADLELTPFRKPPSLAAMPEPAEPVLEPEPFVVFFAFDSDVIDAAAKQVIAEAVATADEMGIVDFSVTGHADRAGPEDYNLELSLRRANAVRDELVARGVKSSGISVAGRGEAENAVPTADGVREPANRRVEIILL